MKADEGDEEDDKEDTCKHGWIESSESTKIKHTDNNQQTCKSTETDSLQTFHRRGSTQTYRDTPN